MRFMPDSASDPNGELRLAVKVLTQWLQSGRRPGGEGFDKLCAEHPELALELQELHSLVRIVQAVATSRSFQQTVREHYGEDAEVTVKLEDGFGVPPSASPVREPLEGGT